MARIQFKLTPKFFEKDTARALSKADRSGGPDACWIWTGGILKNGYGQFGIRRLKERHTLYAHRVAYFLAYGVDPGGLQVCHKCDVKLCVNPAHLWLGDQGQNVRDAVAKGHMQTGDKHFYRRHPELVQRGEQRGKAAKLKEADVIEIRRMFATGMYFQYEIAEMFGVCQTNISMIVNRKHWRHLP